MPQTTPFVPDDLKNLLLPRIRINEKDCPEVGDMKIGQKTRCILNYEVVEKTKSFAVIKVNHIYFTPTKRKY